MRTAIVAGRDPPPVLEFSEHIFDFMALFVEVGVVIDLPVAVFPRWNTRLDPFVPQGFPGLAREK